MRLLAADGPEHLEPVSGMAHLTGIVVEVRPAAGPQDGSRPWPPQRRSNRLLAAFRLRPALAADRPLV